MVEVDLKKTTAEPADKPQAKSKAIYSLGSDREIIFVGLEGRGRNRKVLETGAIREPDEDPEDAAPSDEDQNTRGVSRSTRKLLTRRVYVLAVAAAIVLVLYGSSMLTKLKTVWAGAVLKMVSL